MHAISRLADTSLYRMPYNEEFRKQVLDSISSLQGAGQLYNRRRHTLDQVIKLYTTKLNEKNALLGTAILERMSSHVGYIFTNTNPSTPYEVLDFINTVIRWYFKIQIKRRDKITLAVIPVALPDFTIPEIKELYESMLV